MTVIQLVNMFPKCFCSMAEKAMKNPITNGVATIVKTWATSRTLTEPELSLNSIRSLSSSIPSSTAF